MLFWAFKSFSIAFTFTVLARALPIKNDVRNTSREAFSSREYFYIGGSYIQMGSEHLFRDQMYVEKLSPLEPCQPYPLVFIHGQAQSGTNWLNKPDGGSGWASYFLNQGYVVYIIDQTERARSPWNPTGNTTLTAYPAEYIEQRFTATEKYALWPQAKLHTQWPGTGEMGDPTFDAFYSSNVEFQSNTIVQQRKMQAAGSALLRTIGPAILVAHSQGGIMPWVIADAVPKLVKKIIGLEPTGPPFSDAVFAPAPARAWGLTDIPLSYSPAPTNSTTPLQTQTVPNNSTGLDTCIIQAFPARELINLRNIPVVVITSESSFHAVYDSCTVAFLKQAGVGAEWLRLDEVGIHGNGHMFFLEKNSNEIAGVLDNWIRKNIA